MRNFITLYSVFTLLCACTFDGSADLDPPAPAAPDANDAFDAEGTSPELTAQPRLTPQPVESVDDMPGTYYRLTALPGQISVLSLGDLDAGNDGDYELFRSCGVPTCVPEAGQYHATAVNPLVGFASIQLQSEASGLDTYIVDWAWHHDGGALVALQLRRLLPGDITGTPFLMFRMPDAEPQPPTATLPAQARAIDDLPGVYVRPLPPYGSIGALTLEEPVWTDGRAVGTYRAALPYCLPWCLPETGTYSLVLDSALLGSADLTLIPDNGSDVRELRIDGAWRNLLGDIVSLQLRDRRGLGTPFLMYRQWWTTSDPVAAIANQLTAAELVQDADLDHELATALTDHRAHSGLFESADELGPVADDAPVVMAAGGLCAYYQNLAQYYRTRALQCAYSACYPLSPWYTHWANYYQARADATCAPE